MAAKDIEAGRAHVLIAIRDRVSQGLKTAEAKLRAFGSSVALSAGVLTGGIGAAIAWPIKLAANMEQTKTSFAVFLGSTDLANQKLKEIEAMGAATPFTFDELKDGAQTLLNFGVSADALLPSMRNLGDVSGGNAERFQRLSLAFGQVMGKGRLMGQEVNQMVEAGFNPLQEISRTTGKSMAQLSQDMEDGKISSQQLAAAFASAAGPGGRFSGMMEKQSQTLVGLFSTLTDNAAIAARTFGDAMLPALKTLAQVGITVSKMVTNFITRNQALVQIAGKVILVILAASGAVAAIGATILGVSFVVGLMASAFATLATVFGVIFSPIGVVIGLLIAAAGVVYYFRGAIMQALAPIVAFFQPVIDTVVQLYGVFVSTFGGIVAALQGGSLEQAAAIAWAGFGALAWTAIENVMGAFMSLLSYVDSFLPGLQEMFSAAFSGIGSAILAGRWDLAGSIMMNKLYLVMTQGWNAIALAWDLAIYGFQTVFDTVFTGIKSAFWTTVYGLAKGLAWLSGQISSLLNIEDPLKGALEGLQQMEQQQADSDRKAAIARDAARNVQLQKNAEARGQGEKDLESKIAGLEKEAATAAEMQGTTTVQAKADEARKNLEKTLEDAKKEREAAKAMGTKASYGPEALAGAASSKAGGGGKGSGSSGTFSAIASALGNASNNAVENTAKNTAQLVKIAKQQLAKPAAGMDQ